jgi:SAM-dependent methyltransferase
MDLFKYNSKAWDEEVAKGSVWSIPVSPDEIAAVRKGKLRVILSPSKPVPDSWIKDLKDKDVLCLAGGGGQQGPLLAAAGARVTVLDASQEQLKKDQLVAQREDLKLNLIQGDMRDLSAFADGSFDLIVNPPSNCFIPDVKPVWREAYRVLRKGGYLLSGFNNPITYCFDSALSAQGIMQLKYSVPYSDLTTLSDEERQKYIDRNDPLEFGHTIEDQIGGQTEAGFMITGFYEDIWGTENIEDKYFPHFMITRSVKL